MAMSTVLCRELSYGEEEIRARLFERRVFAGGYVDKLRGDGAGRNEGAMEGLSRCSSVS